MLLGCGFSHFDESLFLKWFFFITLRLLTFAVGRSRFAGVTLKWWKIADLKIAKSCHLIVTALTESHTFQNIGSTKWILKGCQAIKIPIASLRIMKWVALSILNWQFNSFKTFFNEIFFLYSKWSDKCVDVSIYRFRQNYINDLQKKSASKIDDLHLFICN